MNYLKFFQLNKEPFSNAPSADFYYGSKQHERALARLTYAAESMKGLAVLIGDIGMGKTTLARRMLDNLPEREYEAALLVIIHSGITASWLLKRIALQLGVERPADEKLRLLSQLYQRLVSIHDEGKRAIVLIDEAQMLETREIMEEFRGMLNLEIPGHKLITFVLFGLPELSDNLHLDEPLNQRVAVRCRLTSFSPQETINYVKHRLRLAGAQRPIFSAEALHTLQAATDGVPRLINTVCDNVLFEAYAARQRLVGPGLLLQVAEDLGLNFSEAAVAEGASQARAEAVPRLVAAGSGAPAVATGARFEPAAEPEADFEEFDLEQALSEPTPVADDEEPSVDIEVADDIEDDDIHVTIDEDATPVLDSKERAAAASNSQENGSADREQSATAEVSTSSPRSNQSRKDVFREIDEFDEELDIPRIDALDDIDSILDQLDENS